MTILKTVAATAFVAGTLLALLQPAAAETVVRDHRNTPVVRDHRDQPVVRDHRGEEGRVRPTRGPKTICAGWAC